jgi:hypothetical protein
LAGLPEDRAGIRLGGGDDLSRHLEGDSPIGQIAAAVLGPASFPVRAILFDKTEKTNWSLGWHQDRTIVVRERCDAPGYGPWTRKQGMIHVAPPAAVLAKMVTLRVHLDPVPEDNAPLLVARGSHAFGVVVEADVEPMVQRSDICPCLAERGDVWLYATLILHASAAATRPARRRVLQIDYAGGPLSDGLEFRGV